jgi:N6-adenosine-specific RNA methylase IME4
MDVQISEELIQIGLFTLTPTAMRVRGQPTFEQYEDVGLFIKGAHRRCGFWLADWLRYGEQRRDWQERLDQVVDATGLSEKTAKNVRAIGAIPESVRREGVEFSTHGEVASLGEDEQIYWLAEAEAQGWTQRELRVHIRASKRTKIIEGQATLVGQYRVIHSDCPWIYSDSGPTADGSLGKAERHYTGMTIDELCKLPVEAHSLPDSILFFWVTATMLYENPGPREVIEAWGFKPKTGLVWDKVLGMPGNYANHVTHEHLIIATRGHCLPDVPTPQQKSILAERRRDEHSSKPIGVRKWIEQHWTRGPYLELFARERVEGWDCFGNDSRLWAQEKASA